MGQTRLCMLCCCAFIDESFKDLRSAMISKTHFINFCKEMQCAFAEKRLDLDSSSGDHGWNVREEALLHGDLNLDYQKVSVCHDCLRHISATNEIRTEMNEVEGQARALQVQLLKVLEELKQFVNQYYLKLQCIEVILKTSDEPCLNTYIDEHLCSERVRDVLKFRESIMNAVTNLSTYQQQLEEKTHCKAIDGKKKNNRRSESKRVDFHGIKLLKNNDSYQDRDFTVSFNENEVEEGGNNDTSLSLFTLRRSTRPRSATNFLLKNVVEESESENEDRCDVASEAGSNFSDCGVGLLEEEERSTPHSSSPQMSGMSEFMLKIVDRVHKGKLSTCNSAGISNESKARKRKPKRRKNTKSRAELPSYSDPLVKYPMEFDFKTQKLVVNETEIIVQENNNSLKCSLCEYVITECKAKTSRVERIMQDHIIGKHIRGYKCDICGYILGRYRNYKAHMQTPHSGPNDSIEWNCDICGKPFKSEEGTKIHKWYHMNKEEMEDAIRNGMKPPRKPYDRFKKKPRDVLCPTCGKAFRSRHEVKAHEERMHKNRQRIMCQKCGKMILPGSSMRYHNLACTKRDTNEVYECLVCQKTFQNKFLLRQHKRRYHSATSSERQFVCFQCGKAFAHKCLLENHETVHSDEKPFKCEGCSSSYKRKNNLRRHQKSCKIFNL